MASHNIPPGWVAANHLLQIDVEDMHNAQVDREFIERLIALRTPTRRRAYLNQLLRQSGSGLVAIRCPRNNARAQ